jgi:mono/diheme cytochrome c family protein
LKRTRMAAILVLACCLILAPRAAAQAEDLYKAHCSSCHGADGSGSTTAGKKMGLSDLRSPQVQSLSDDELFKTIAYGVKHKQYPHAFMKRGLTEEQITQLVSYLRKLPKSK